MRVSLKMLEEEDLIFMNSTCCCSYFGSFKRFPGHQQKLPNTSGALCKLMTWWVRSPANEFVWATGTCYHQPQWIQGKNEGEEENISQDCYWNPQSEILDNWYHDVHWPGCYSQALLSFCITDTGCFSLNGFFYFHRKAAPRAGWTRPQEPPAHREWKLFSLLATNATVLVLLRNRSNISIYTWILQTSIIFSNFCGHVNVTEFMEDLKPIQSKAQVLMAWIHIGWTVKGKVLKMWKVLFWKIHSSEIDIKAILQIKSAMWSAMACSFI